MQYVSFSLPWGLTLSQISLDSKYQLLKVSRNIAYCQFKSYPFSALNPECACGSTLSYWFKAEQLKKVFMEAAYGGKPAWFSFVESFWSEERLPWNSQGCWAERSRRGLRPRPFVWTALISGFQREGGAGRKLPGDRGGGAGDRETEGSRDSPAETSSSILHFTIYLLSPSCGRTFTFCKILLHYAQE